ncbi:snakin-2 [Solanum pennellii]|uniref:Snakin-2 n=1 Tax=Solanum pennellii TaxID=28526 RepID=A0ABM1FZR4_SOLPN|nr:snakin-2 [Solanum pennellii]
MAISKALFASLLLSLLLLEQVHSIQTDQVSSNAISEAANSYKKIDCGGACAARCRLSSRPRLCHRACGTCCARCNCVPPGTSGNTETCPCYASLTTHGNKRKCP